MVSTSTVSQEHALALFQKLLELKNKNELPEQLEGALRAVIDAQNKLADEVQCHLHNGFETSSKDAVKLIIETCPEFLSSEKDIGHGSLFPVYNVAFTKHNNSSVYIPMFAEAGYRHGVGGPNGRGGLLVKSPANCNVFENISRFINFQSDAEKEDIVETFKNLSAMDPQLFRLEDIQTYGLLHNVASSGENVQLAKYLIDLDPSALHMKALEGLPIHCCCDNELGSVEMLQLVFASGVKHIDKGECEIGGLFEKDVDGCTAFDLAIDSFGEDETWRCIEKCLAVDRDGLPILHHAIPNVSQHHLGGFFIRFPDSLFVRDEKGRLPVHVALECGLDWSLELLSCLLANKEETPQTYRGAARKIKT